MLPLRERKSSWLSLERVLSSSAIHIGKASSNFVSGMACAYPITTVVYYFPVWIYPLFFFFFFFSYDGPELDLDMDGNYISRLE